MKKTFIILFSLFAVGCSTTAEKMNIDESLLGENPAKLTIIAQRLEKKSFFDNPGYLYANLSYFPECINEKATKDKDKPFGTSSFLLGQNEQSTNIPSKRKLLITAKLRKVDSVATQMISFIPEENQHYVLLLRAGAITSPLFSKNNKDDTFLSVLLKKDNDTYVPVTDSYYSPSNRKPFSLFSPDFYHCKELIDSCKGSINEEMLRNENATQSLECPEYKDISSTWTQPPPPPMPHMNI